MKRFEQTPQVQGQDSILIDVPAAELWELIRDSKQMEQWGPPVEKVEVSLLPHQQVEEVGSERKVFAKFSEKRRGWYKETRTEQIEGQSVTFIIHEDSFGMDKMLQDVGAKMEIQGMGKDQSLFTFTFYHRTKNIFGVLMNPWIRLDQKKNRLKALNSIKSYAEKGIAIKN